MVSQVYSPSSTTTWKRCPVLWQLTQQGVVKRELGKRDLAAALGSAFAQGMHVYHRTRQAGGLVLAGPAVDAAMGYWLAQQQAWQDEGRRLLEGDEAQYANVGPRVAKLVTYAIHNDPLPPDWVPVAVEESLGPEYGNARPDLVCRKADGQLVVIDYKSTLTLGTRADERKRKLAYRLDDWRDSDQLYHYAWALGAEHVVIVLAEVEPKPQLTLHDFWLPRDQVDIWYEHQHEAWNVMVEHQTGHGFNWRAATHSDQFGRCEMYDWCYGAVVERDVAYTTRTRGL